MFHRWHISNFRGHLSDLIVAYRGTISDNFFEKRHLAMSQPWHISDFCGILSGLIVEYHSTVSNDIFEKSQVLIVSFGLSPTLVAFLHASPSDVTPLT